MDRIEPIDPDHLEEVTSSVPWQATTALMLEFSEISRLASSTERTRRYRILAENIQVADEHQTPLRAAMTKQWERSAGPVRRYKKEHWIDALFLRKDDCDAYRHLVDYLSEIDPDTNKSRSEEVEEELERMRADMQAIMIRGLGRNVLERLTHTTLRKILIRWSDADFSNISSPLKKTAVREYRKVVLDKALGEIDTWVHFRGTLTLVKLPLENLARNLPLLPDTFGENDELIAVSPVAAQVPPLVLGVRAELPAVLSDVFLGLPFKIVSIVRHVIGSRYMQRVDGAGNMSTYPVSIRIFMNQAWPTGSGALELDEAHLNGESTDTRNILIHIPSQAFDKNTGRMDADGVAYVFVDASEYIGTYKIEQLDKFELEVLLPNLPPSVYLDARRDSARYMVSRWRAYVNRADWSPIQRRLDSDMTIISKGDERIPASQPYVRPAIDDETSALIPTQSPSQYPVPLITQGHAYKTMPRQSKTECTAMALTAGAYILALDTTNEGIVSLDALDKKRDGILSVVADGLYQSLQYCNADYTSLPEKDYSLINFLSDDKRSDDVLAYLSWSTSSVYPYYAYTLLVPFWITEDEKQLAISSIVARWDKTPLRLGTIRQLITSTMASPHLRRYRRNSQTHEIDGIHEPGFLIAFTGRGHSITVIVLSAFRPKENSYAIDPRTIKSARNHRYLYYDSLGSSNTDVSSSSSSSGTERSYPALLISFQTAEELDAYFYTKHGNGGLYDRSLFILKTPELPYETQREHLREIHRHGFLPATVNGTGENEGPKLVEELTAESTDTLAPFRPDVPTVLSLHHLESAYHSRVNRLGAN